MKPSYQGIIFVPSVGMFAAFGDARERSTYVGHFPTLREAIAGRKAALAASQRVEAVPVPELVRRLQWWEE